MDAPARRGYLVAARRHARPNRRILTCPARRAKAAAVRRRFRPVPPLPLGRRLALWLAAVLGLWTAAVVASGGVSFVVGGLRVSSRSAGRPAALALAMLALALWRLPAEARRRWLGAVADGADRHAPWLAAVLALAVTLLSVLFGSHVAGGSDSSGYLSQSRLWAAGRLTADAPVISDAPWPARGQLVAPLGYRPAPAPDQLGPTYAPGLPLLMAFGAAVAGDAGRYVWTPLAAGLLVWATFRLAAFAAPPAAALAAAALVATSPPMLFQTTETMSDLPVAALWAWALVWLRRPGTGARAAAGVFSALALLVRPNMAPAAAAVWSAVLAVERRVAVAAADARRAGRGAAGARRAGRRAGERVHLGFAVHLGVRPPGESLQPLRHPAQPAGPVDMDGRDAWLLDGRRTGGARRAGRAARQRPGVVAGARAGGRRAGELPPVRHVRRVVVPALLPAGVAGTRGGASWQRRGNCWQRGHATRPG